MNVNTMSNVNMMQNAQFNFAPQQAAAQQQSAMQNAHFNFAPQQAAAQQQSAMPNVQYNLLAQQALEQQVAQQQSAMQNLLAQQQQAAAQQQSEKPYFSLEQFVGQHGREALMKAAPSSLLQGVVPGIPQSLFGVARKAPPELPVASLQQLRKADPTVVRTVHDALASRGFIWLRFEAEDTLAEAAAAALPAAGNFLAEAGASGTLHAMQGHFSAAQKDGLRFVTGTSLEHTTGLDKVPAETQAVLKQMAQQFDQAQIDIVAALGPSLLRGQFRETPSKSQVVEKVGEFYDIPLLQRAEKGMTSYGLLDIVRYGMGAGSPDEVVAAHTDPGLFILSLPCSTPGLELQDEDKAWRSPPPGLGVLWAGNAAAMLRRLKSGMHRVRATPDRAPRLSAWHELCTRAQLCPPMLDALEANGRELKLGDLRGTDAVLRHLQAAEAAQAAVIGPERDQWRVQYFVRQSEMNRREVDFEHHLEAALRKSDLFLQRSPRSTPRCAAGPAPRRPRGEVRCPSGGGIRANPERRLGDVDRYSIFKTNVFMKGWMPGRRLVEVWRLMPMRRLDLAEVGVEWCASSVTRDSLQDVQKTTKPAPVVKDVLEAVSVLLGQPETRWDRLKQMISKPQFFEKLQRLDFQRSITKEQFKKLRDKLTHPHFDEELIKTVSVPIVPLAMWCRAIGVHLSKTKYRGGPEVRPVAGAGASVPQPRYEDRRSSAVAMTIQPDLSRMSSEELRHVRDLTISREGVGTITFEEETDVTGLDFETIVRLEVGEVLVYPQPRTKPEIGVGLNKAATVTMYQCWPPNGSLLAQDKEQQEEYKRRIKLMTEEKKARFLDYDCNTGVWKFAVEHF
eukprot:s521_g4.t3